MKIINYSKLTVPELGEDDEIEDFTFERAGNNHWKFQHRNKLDNELEELELRLKAKRHYMIGQLFSF